MKRSVVALSTIALLAASCGSHTQSAPDPTTPEPVQRASPAPTPAAHVGETINLLRIGDQKIAVTLDQIINPATVTDGRGDPGKTYVATKLTITNTGTTTIVGNGNSNVIVVGTDNQSYSSDLNTVYECKDFKYGWFIIPVGSSSTGCVVFALPPGVTPAKVKYTPSSGISRHVGEWLSS